jgi:hypothetical protein
MSDYEFSPIFDDLKTNADIEGKTGAPLAIGRSGISLIVLAATDENPRWVAKSKDARRELRRLENLNAPKERRRARAIQLYVDAIIIDWFYVDSEGVKHPGPPDASGNFVPFSREAITAFLTGYSDAFRAVENTIYEESNFRGAKLEAVFDSAKN